MPRRLDVASGANAIEQPLGEFIVRIVPGESLDASAAKVTAKLLAPSHLSERQRASGIPSTVDMSIPVDQAIELAIQILSAAGAKMTSDQIAEAQRLAREWKSK